MSELRSEAVPVEGDGGGLSFSGASGAMAGPTVFPHPGMLRDRMRMKNRMSILPLTVRHRCASPSRTVGKRNEVGKTLRNALFQPDLRPGSVLPVGFSRCRLKLSGHSVRCKHRALTAQFDELTGLRTPIQRTGFPQATDLARRSVFSVGDELVSTSVQNYVDSFPELHSGRRCLFLQGSQGWAERGRLFLLSTLMGDKYATCFVFGSMLHGRTSVSRRAGSCAGLG